MNVIAVKKALREQWRERRAVLTKAARDAGAVAAARAFTAHSVFASRQFFAAYLARDSEFDLTLVIQALWQAQKACYLPVLAPDGTKHLCFMPYQAATPLSANHYHILEPEYVPALAISAPRLDVVFIPLTAFTRQGARLGSGGGYYDRTFAFLQNKQNAQAAPLLIGVGFALQQIPDLPHAPWDIQLDGILTENEFTLFTNQP